MADQWVSTYMSFLSICADLQWLCVEMDSEAVIRFNCQKGHSQLGIFVLSKRRQEEAYFHLVFAISGVGKRTAKSWQTGLLHEIV